MPIGPAPITIRWPGNARLSKIVSLVKYGTASIPGIGGIAADDPVAMTNRRAATVRSPAATSVGPTKRAQSPITRTPSPSNRSTESFGAIAAMT